MAEDTDTKTSMRYKLSDTAIAGLMQLLTLAIATGTNLLDHMRNMDLEVGDDGHLELTPEFIANTETFIQDCLARIPDDPDTQVVV